MNAANALVAGSVAPGFEVVRDAFALNLQAGLEVGASFSATYRGELIVDLWGGYADEELTTLIQRDSLFNLWSTTKGLSATCIAILVDRGTLSYESPVAEYWPEFAQNGKQAVTVGQMMSHQAGICGPREPVTIEDYYAHSRVASLLAAQKPLWRPGSAWGYHAIAIGTLADELVRRVDGRTIGRFFAAEVATPLGVDAHLGLPASEDHRQVEMIPPPAIESQTFDVPNPEAYRCGLANPVLDPEWPNNRSWRAAGLAGAGGSANARGLAGLYGVLANGGEFAGTRILSAKTIVEATKERIAGVDQGSGEYGRYAAGFHLNMMNGAMGAHAQSFGHGGWGGSIAFADPRRGLGVAYVMNQMLINDWGNVDYRLARLLSATYRALEKM
jgi:CubicO group peptidase (beta-lactamase class C family)